MTDRPPRPDTPLKARDPPEKEDARQPLADKKRRRPDVPRQDPATDTSKETHVKRSSSRKKEKVGLQPSADQEPRHPDAPRRGPSVTKDGEKHRRRKLSKTRRGEDQVSRRLDSPRPGSRRRDRSHTKDKEKHRKREPSQTRRDEDQSSHSSGAKESDKQDETQRHSRSWRSRSRQRMDRKAGDLTFPVRTSMTGVVLPTLGTDTSSRRMQPSITSSCPYLKPVRRGRSPTRRGTKDADVDENKTTDDIKDKNRRRSSSRRRAESLKRQAQRMFGRAERERSKSLHRVVNTGARRSILLYEWEDKNVTIHIRLVALEHGKWATSCAINFLVEVSISRGELDISDMTIKLYFRSSKTKQAMFIPGFSPLQILGDVLPVDRERGVTRRAGLSLQAQYATANYEEGRDEKEQWVEPNRYKLELDNASDTVLTARLYRVGTKVFVPSSFQFNIVVDCPRGEGIDMAGDLELSCKGKEGANGHWRKVELDSMARVKEDYSTWKRSDCTGWESQDKIGSGKGDQAEGETSKEPKD